MVQASGVSDPSAHPNQGARAMPLAANAGVYVLPVFGATPTRIAVIPTSDSPEGQTTDTVAAMVTQIGQTVHSPQVSKATAQALRGIGSSDREKAHAIFRWIKRNVKFVKDSSIIEKGPKLVDTDEALIAPDRLLTMPKPQGDCDDFTQLASAMLWNAGIENSIVTIAADREEPQRFSHVYNQVSLRGVGEVPFDSSHGKELGWEAPVYFRKKVWKIMPLQVVSELDRQVIEGRQDRRFAYQRKQLSPVSQQVIKAIPGFKGVPRGMGDTTVLDTPWSGGGTSWGGFFQNIASVFAGPIATAVGASIMPSGSMIQQGPQGSVLVTGAYGQPYQGGYPSGVSIGGTSGPLLLIGGAAVLLVLIMGMKN